MEVGWRGVCPRGQVSAQRRCQPEGICPGKGGCLPEGVYHGGVQPPDTEADPLDPEADAAPVSEADNLLDPEADTPWTQRQTPPGPRDRHTPNEQNDRQV